MNIIITGFMGSGKTTIGRKLAKLIEYSFVDTDSEIEDDQGCSVSEILSTEVKSVFVKWKHDFWKS